MAHLLASWKEIARYLGKGIRTVQRWERDLGLPVRRFDGRAEHRVLAFCEELDEWVVSRNAQNGSDTRAVLTKCRLDLAELNRANESLRKEVESLQAELSELQRKLPGTADLILRSRQSVKRSALPQQEGREIIELRRNLQLLHANDGNPSISRFVHLGLPPQQPFLKNSPPVASLRTDSRSNAVRLHVMHRGLTEEPGSANSERTRFATPIALCWTVWARRSLYSRN